MDLAGVVEHFYLPLLTQETAVMVATFTYGLKEGLQPAALVAIDAAAVLTDLALFFAPSYVLPRGMRGIPVWQNSPNRDRAAGLVARWGVVRATAVMAFALPSVTSMLIAGLLRLPFWRALAGLLAGTALYIVIPLALALPLAASLPPLVVGILPWVGPLLAVIVVLISLLRACPLLRG